LRPTYAVLPAVQIEAPVPVAQPKPGSGDAASARSRLLIARRLAATAQYRVNARFVPSPDRTYSRETASWKCSAAKAVEMWKTGSKWVRMPLLAATLSCVAAPDLPPPEEATMTIANFTTNRTVGAPRSARPRMQAQVTGQGPRLVLVGGGLTGWASWAPHAERLAATREVARLQLLSVGHGLEDRPLPEGYSVGMESAALADALDSLGWAEPVDLVAWSYGALITLDFALNHPARVRSLTLIEPPALWVLPDHGQGDPDVEALFGLARNLSPEVTERDLVVFLNAAALVPPGVAPQELPQWPVWLEHRRSLRGGTVPLDHRDDPARLREFGPPVLLVTGTDTSPFLRRVHDTLAANFPAARTLELPAGHAPQIVSMDRFLEELARFHQDPDSAVPTAGGGGRSRTS
jgi:pimeloyl-ACP methyl ester carboxylesterase